MYTYTDANPATPWNKGKIVGQKPPLKIKEIWALRVRLQLAHRTRELALFNLAIDSKLRGCDLVQLHVRDVQRGAQYTTTITLAGRRRLFWPVANKLSRFFTKPGWEWDGGHRATGQGIYVTEETR